MAQKALVIGSGFAGLSSAICLADFGFSVQILEKNSSVGGRARQFESKGFTFDMGPSWYWMPDVFEKFFARFGKTPSDYYDLIRLDPSYKVVFEKDEEWIIPSNFTKLKDLFEKVEPGSSVHLEAFLREAAYKYKVGMEEMVFKPSHSIWEFLDMKIAKGAINLHLLKSFSAYVRKFFKDERILKLVEFPVLFLGAKPEKTPALYSIMNYADMKLGTWYPMGGMHKIVEALKLLAEEKGVEFINDCKAEKIEVEDGHALGLHSSKGWFEADWIVAAADYEHVEQNLLSPEFRRYDREYWNSRTMAPSSLLFYLGIDEKVSNLEHHNLFFDEDFDQHAVEIYDDPQWPEKPLFYVCCPSKTDPSVAPQGKENVFILMPVAPGLKDEDETREKYFHLIMDRLEKHTGQKLRDKIIFKKSYAHSNFIEDYNAFKGNAYGLANTLKQTAFLKPGMRNKKVKNLIFAGQLTTPGPGVPPSLISGQVAAEEVRKMSNTQSIRI